MCLDDCCHVSVNLFRLGNGLANVRGGGQRGWGGKRGLAGLPRARGEGTAHELALARTGPQPLACRAAATHRRSWPRPWHHHDSRMNVASAARRSAAVQQSPHDSLMNWESTAHPSQTLPVPQSRPRDDSTLVPPTRSFSCNESTAITIKSGGPAVVDADVAFHCRASQLCKVGSPMTPSPTI